MLLNTATTNTSSSLNHTYTDGINYDFVLGGVTTSSGVTTSNNYTICPSAVESISVSWDDLNRLVEKDIKNMNDKKNCKIIDVVEIVPEKVYKFIFQDKTEIKTVCDKNDVFDLKYMFYLAIAKKLYSKTLTFDGVLYKSYEIQYEKQFNKIVKNGVKILKQKQEAKRKEEEEKATKKAIQERKKEKAIQKKKVAKERKKKEQINIIAEAIRQSKNIKVL